MGFSVNSTRWFLIVIVLVGAGCSTTTFESIPVPDLWRAESSLFAPAPLAEGTYRDFDILFATDRRLRSPREIEEDARDGIINPYNHLRTPRVRYGVTTVQVNLQQHLTASVHDVREFGRHHGDSSLGRSEFVSELSQRLVGARRKQVYIYVHGYNRDFAQASFSTGLLTSFLADDAVMILYTWPAKIGGVLTGAFGYAADRESADYTVGHFKDFLRLVTETARDATVNIVAHSVGGWVVTKALAELHLEQWRATNIANLVLAAPDISFDVFTERMLKPGLPEGIGHMTIYAAAEDRALSLSQFLQAGPRLGAFDFNQFGFMARENRFLSGIDLINASGLEQYGFFGHSYFLDNPQVSSDLILLLKYNRAAKDRPLEVLHQHGCYAISADYLSGIR